jgi:uncharacterized membrane protein
MDPNQQYGQQPSGQPPYAATAGRWGVSALGNLGAEVMAGLAYLIVIVPFVGFIAQIVLFALEKNRFSKFHAAQAMCLSVLAYVLGIIDFIVSAALGIGFNSNSAAIGLGSAGISLLFGCLFFIVGLVIFGFWIWGMIAAFTGKPTKLPIVGNIAEGLAGGPVTAV